MDAIDFSRMLDPSMKTTSFVEQNKLARLGSESK
ncbi:uncharacterized protein LOC112083988 [Eutrema salsugineum]|nr:uncharacterized protein LOC112083988 [Eutrema salsugineum]